MVANTKSDRKPRKVRFKFYDVHGVIKVSEYLLGLPKYPLPKSKLKQVARRVVSEDSRGRPVLKKNTGKGNAVMTNDRHCLPFDNSSGHPHTAWFAASW